MTSNPPRGDDHIRELIERSSLGEPGAARLRHRTSHELADAVIADRTFPERAHEVALIFEPAQRRSQPLVGS
jgi:hypothetical protein